MTDPKDVLKRLREAENREIQQIRRAGGERHFLYLFRDAAEVIESLTASQARDEIVEECAKVAGEYVNRPYDIPSRIRSLKTGDRDAG
jgi:hypothetical protein